MWLWSNLVSGVVPDNLLQSVLRKVFQMKRKASEDVFKVDPKTVLFVIRLLQEFYLRVPADDLCEEMGLAEGNRREWINRWMNKGLLGPFGFFGHLDSTNENIFAHLVTEEFRCLKKYQRNRA